MTNIQTVKEGIDLRLIVEQDLGRPVSRGSRAWTFKCPFHHETKGASLSVYKDGWKCWGACQENGDALSWVARRCNLDLHRPEDFREALRLLGGDLPYVNSWRLPRWPTAAPLPEAAEPPSQAWQAAALEIVERAERNLWSPAGRSALNYLVKERGLWPHTIQQARLGYVNDSIRAVWAVNGLLVPTHSITIPWFTDGQLWGIKCRRLAGNDPRYKEVSAARDGSERLGKSKLHSALYWADLVTLRQPVFIIEGEFNCLVAWQAASHLVCPVSLGPSGATLNGRWLPYLITAPIYLGWFDNDSAGHKGANRLAGLAGSLTLLNLPEGAGKDINDFWVSSRSVGETGAVTAWLEAALSSIGGGEIPNSPDNRTD